MLLSKHQSGFALPMVMLLGIALTFILGSLITQGVTDKTTLSERAASFSAQQQLQFAQDHAIHSLLEEVNDNGFVNTVTTAIPSCFDQFSNSTTRILVDNISVNAHSADYIVRQTQRSGHMVRLGNNINQLNLHTLGETGYIGDMTIDLWLKVHTNNNMDIVVSPNATNNQIVTLVPGSGSNAELRLLNDSSLSTTITVGEWYYVLLQLDGDVYKLYVGQQTIPTAITSSSGQSNKFAQGDWVIGKGAGQIDVAAIRAWQDYSSFDLDEQFVEDKNLPGNATQSPTHALYFDSSTDTDMTSNWTLPIGRASATSPDIESFSIDYAETDTLSERHAPPAHSEIFLFDGCSNGAKEQQRILINRDTARGVFSWEG